MNKSRYILYIKFIGEYKYTEYECRTFKDYEDLATLIDETVSEAYLKDIASNKTIKKLK